MKTYFAYVRVSTPRQGEGVSPDEQRRVMEEYARKHDLTIVRWYMEKKTAAKVGRLIFNQMLAERQRERVDGIIIHKIDRSARNMKDWATINDLIEAGVDIHFAHESLDLHTRGGRLAADIQAVVAADFIRNLSQEATKGIQGRLNQGLCPWAAPPGYLNLGKGRPKAIDPVLGPVVRAGFELYADGTHTLHMMREEWFQLGLRTRGGKMLSVNGVATILHNPFYIGLLHHKARKRMYEGIHEPLITKKLFDQAQAIMAGRVPARPIRHASPYRKLIRCAACSYALIAELQKGRTYFRCHTKACAGVTLREDAATDAIWAVLALLSFSEREIEELGELAADRVATGERSHEQRISAANLALAKCEDRLSRLTDALLEGVIDTEAFDLKRSELLLERRGLKDALDEQRSQHPLEALLKNIELANTALHQAEKPSDEDRRRFVQRFTSNLIAEGKNLVVRLQFPFDVVADWRYSQTGDPTRVVHRTNGTWTLASTVDPVRLRPELVEPGLASLIREFIS